MVSRTEKCTRCKNKNLLVECKCGCGQVIHAVSKWYDNVFYIKGHNQIGESGDRNRGWKGGKKEHNGYWLVWKSEHRYADKNGYVAEHRLVMEEHIGRYLESWEAVHHINGIKTDNRIENLQLITNSEHTVLHKTGFKHSIQTRIKMSVAHKGNKSWTGLKRTEEQKLKIAASLRGKKHPKKRKLVYS